jgi:hypothetical protein
VAVGFVLTRVAYWAAGVRFDLVPLAGFWQFIEADLLRGDLLRSVWHLHSQPPLFNLFLGVVLKLCQGWEAAAFHGAYLGFGLVLALSLCALQLRLGVPRILATGLTLVFVASPACILYENWLFYDYPVLTLLTVSALFLHRFVDGGRLRDGVVFFALLAALVLVRGLFHLGWLALLAGLLTVLWPAGRRRVLLASGAPLLVAFLWYARTFVLFGSFTGSTWLGMNFSDITTLKVPRAERTRMVADGVLSPLALIKSFSPVDVYRPYVPFPEPAGVPVLDRERKASGAPNLNHRAYIPVARQYLRDALTVLRRRPGAYADGCFEAWVRYSFPASESDWLAGNRSKIAALDRLYATAICGRFVYDRWPPSPEVVSPAREMSRGRKLANAGMFLLVGCPLLIVYGLVLTWRALRHGDRATGLVLLFLCLTLLYVTVVGNALEVGENYRNRFSVSACYVVLFGLWVGGRRPRRTDQSS